MYSMKYSLSVLQAAAAALLLAACTQDEQTGDGTTLPYGEYPLQIGSVTLSAEVSGQPWTRVVENENGTGSVWQANDEFAVQLDDKTANYTVQADGTTSPSGEQLYWKNTAPATVTAWYPTNADIDLSDQSEGLAYVLQASVPNATYNSEITLGFTHQLAKVRIALDGDQMNSVTSMEVYGYTSCTNNNGVVTGGDEQGWIKMKHTTYADGTKCWEANVVPGTIDIKNFIRLNGYNVLTEDNWQGFDDNTLKAGTINTIDLTVGKTEIDLGTYTGTTLTVSGRVTLTGTNSNLQITLQDGADVTLDNVTLAHTAGGPVIRAINGENFTLTLKGDNKLKGTTITSYSTDNMDENDGNYGSGIFVYAGTLTINSEQGATLTIDREIENPSLANQYYGAGIGLGSEGHLVITGGSITIDTVDDTGKYSGAGIGYSLQFTSGNGSIKITGGNITIGQGGTRSAAIGCSSYWDQGSPKMNITITGENTVITAAKSTNVDCIIGNVVGNIYIGGGATVNDVKYTDENAHTGEL